MAFINPKIDFAFKKIFGSEESHDILISFLNAILYEGEPTIQSVTIIDPYLAPKIRGIKDTFVDVRATIIDSQGQTREVIIEMQVLNVEGFEKRILYNAAKTYATQLETGADYLDLEPVIALTITDFVMFSELSSIISRFILKERTYLVDYPIYDIELVFVELPKFRKGLEELRDEQDKWIYFLSAAAKLKEIPEVMRESAIGRAFRIAEQSNLSREELEDLEKRAIFIHDQRNAMIKAERIGREQGKQEGLQEGREQGKQEGLQEGREQGKQEGLQDMLKRLLNRKFGNLSDPLLTQLEQLTSPQLEDLAEAILDMHSLADLERWFCQPP